MNRRRQALPVVRGRIDRVIAVLDEELNDIDTDLTSEASRVAAVEGSVRTFCAASPAWGQA